MIETITPQALKDWLANNSAVLIDVREQEEYDQAHIQGAQLLPLSCFDPQALASQTNKPLVFQCKSGMRSEKAAQIARHFYPDTAMYNLDGGIEAWAAAGFEIVLE